MYTVIDKQSFPMSLYKHDYPRLYVKEEPSYRYTRMFLTKLGAISVASFLFAGFTILALLII